MTERQTENHILERAVFPLNSVLFPGAVMQLAIFEPRYLEMVSQCLSNEVQFIVCRILEGEETGDNVEFEPVGTFAHIIDFDQRDDGILVIEVMGGERVCVMNYFVNEIELYCCSEFRVLPELQDLYLPNELKPLRDLLIKLVNLPEVRVILEDDMMDSLEYIVHQVAQLLPLSLAFKQYLLEENDNFEKAMALYEQLLSEAADDS